LIYGIKYKGHVDLYIFERDVALAYLAKLLLLLYTVLR
jgi:hypothetical protein